MCACVHFQRKQANVTFANGPNPDWGDRVGFKLLEQTNLNCTLPIKFAAVNGPNILFAFWVLNGFAMEPKADDTVGTHRQSR